MPLAARHTHTLADYLGLERVSPTKHEYFDGQISAMAGGTPRHNYLVAGIGGLLRSELLGRPCYPVGADQRIATGDHLYTYADGSVFCGPIALRGEDTAANPVVLIEVLSDSTRTYDRGEKLERYKTIPTLRHVVLIEQDAVDVEVWTRGPTGAWTRVVHVDREARLRLDAIEVELAVGEIYAGVERVQQPSGGA